VEMPKSVPAPVEPMKPAAAAKPNNKSALLVSLVYVFIRFVDCLECAIVDVSEVLLLHTLHTLHAPLQFIHMHSFLIFSQMQNSNRRQESWRPRKEPRMLS